MFSAESVHTGPVLLEDFEVLEKVATLDREVLHTPVDAKPADVSLPSSADLGVAWA